MGDDREHRRVRFLVRAAYVYKGGKTVKRERKQRAKEVNSGEWVYGSYIKCGQFECILEDTGFAFKRRFVYSNTVGDIVCGGVWEDDIVEHQGVLWIVAYEPSKKAYMLKRGNEEIPFAEGARVEGNIHDDAKIAREIKNIKNFSKTY